MLPLRHAIAQLLGIFPLGPRGMRNDPSLLNLQFHFTHIITHDPIEPSANRFQSSCASLSQSCRRKPAELSTFCSLLRLHRSGWWGHTVPPEERGMLVIV